MTVELTGDWAKLRALADRAGKGKLFEPALQKALLHRAHLLRGHMVAGFRTQAPAGQAWKPLSEMTLAARRLKGFGGTKALIHTGQLRRSIAVHSTRPLEVFIGVHRKVTRKDARGRSMVDVARVHEFGATFVVRVTPKMRRFLFVLLKSMGKTPGPAYGKKGTYSPVIIVKIPARPFVRPVFERYARHDLVMKTIRAAVAKELGLKAT